MLQMGWWDFKGVRSKVEPQAQTVSQNYHPTLDGAITLTTLSVQGDSGAAALLKLEIGMLLLPLPLT